MKFLVIRFSSLGDIIMTTAFLKALKDKYKNSQIYYATKSEFAEILKHQPFIDGLFALKKNTSITSFAKELNNYRFDCVFDLHKNPRSIALSYLVKTKAIKRVNKHILYRQKLIHKRLFWFIKDRTTDYNIDDQLALITDDFKNKKPVLYVKKADITLKKPVIGIAPGAKWKTKIWPKEHFKSLTDMIINNLGYDVFIFGSKDELDIANYIKKGYKNVMNFAGKLSIKETAEYMAHCSLLVSNDSALMHLAVALDIPVAAMFGPTVKEFGFYPKGRSVVLEKKGLNCRPCSLHGSDNCPVGTHQCMKDITPNEVFESIKYLLEVKKDEQ